MEASFEAEVARQQDMVTRWRFVSPALVAREAFDAIAGTGLERHRAFVSQVERYRMASQQPFTFSEPPRAATIGRVLTGLAALLAASIVLALATGYAVRRSSIVRV